MPLFSGKCRSQARLDGKVALVTGCNTGIGKETVRDFYSRGAHVVMACRDLEKAEKAKIEIENSFIGEKTVGQLSLVRLDLTSLDSVRECAKIVLEKHDKLNILVNNAGVMTCPEGKTKDGFETQFGINHLAHFLLTCLLLKRIVESRPARIVTVSSLAHELGSIDFEDPNFEKRSYSAVTAYNQSKLANVLFSWELSSRLKAHNIDDVNTYSLHPGVIDTDLFRHYNKVFFPGAKEIIHFGRFFIKSPKSGAQTSIYCALDEKCATETGFYYSDCKKTKPSKAARNPETASKLWTLSCKLVEIEDPLPLLNTNNNV